MISVTGYTGHTPPPSALHPYPNLPLLSNSGLKEFHALEKGKPTINAYNISMVIKLEYLHWSEHCIVNSPEAG